MEIKKCPYCGDDVILDDDSDMLEEQMPFFVKTSTYNGLLFENYLKARRILSGDDPSAEDFYE